MRISEHALNMTLVSIIYNAEREKHQTTYYDNLFWKQRVGDREALHDAHIKHSKKIRHRVASNPSWPSHKFEEDLINSTVYWHLWGWILVPYKFHFEDLNGAKIESEPICWNKRMKIYLGSSRNKKCHSLFSVRCLQ